MATLLSIATYGSQCSVVLSNEGKVVLHKEAQEANSHSSFLTPFIEEILLHHNKPIDAVAYISGPGSYTGLRIGCSAAKGICFSRDIPLIEISTLQLLVSQNLSSNTCDFLCPMIDARRDEVFQGVFSNDGKLIEKEAPKILFSNSYEEILSKHTILFFGSGSKKWEGMISNHTNAHFGKTSDSHPPDILAQLAHSKFEAKEFADLSYSEPSYLKPFFLSK